jgi:hypothetical protein
MNQELRSEVHLDCNTDTGLRLLVNVKTRKLCKRGNPRTESCRLVYRQRLAFDDNFPAIFFAFLISAGTAKAILQIWRYRQNHFN